MDFGDSRVLVTGGAGFIGSEVVRQLVEQEAFVTVLDNFSSGKWEYLEDRNKLRVVVGDLRDIDKTSEALMDQDYVVNLAALPFIPDSYLFPQDFFQINTIGSINLLWRAIESGEIEHFVHISTSEVYGTAKYIPMDEEHPLNPHSTYAVSKLAADRAVFTMHKEHDFPATIIRPFNSFGPNITQPYIIPEIIVQLQNGLTTLRLGNIESSRDFTYVEDTARGILMALKEKRAIGETINIGSGFDIKIKELATLIAKLMGKEIKIEIDLSRFRPYDVQRLYCSNELAEKILGWRPEVSIEDGLRRTIDWVARNGVHFVDPFKGWSNQYRTLASMTENVDLGIMVR